MTLLVSRNKTAAGWLAFVFTLTLAVVFLLWLRHSFPGWRDAAWLVKAGDKLKVVKTANADNPLTQGMQPLLTLDVWEHAYYLDYQNRRPDYLTAVIGRLIDWDFVNANLG